jgi:general secretion pathway protein N
MRTFPAIVLGIAAYAVFLVATLPASFVAERIATGSQGRIAFDGTSGTAWNGTASLTTRLPNATIRVERLAWRWLPAQLATGRIAFAVEGSDGTLAGQGEVARTLGAWHFARWRLSGDASALSRYVPLAAAWQPSGILAIEVPGLAFDGTKFNGTATAEWRAATVSLSDVRPLGSWRASLDAADGPARVIVTTIEGPLKVAGTGMIAIPGRVTFTGEARADPAQEKALEPLLKLFGARRADGAWPIEAR